MQEEEIYIVSYDANWPTKFAEEKELIEKTLGTWIYQGIHHVGSTSVPGLSAKPIIDIMVGVKNLEEANICIPLLEQIQYYYYPYKPEQIIWFCKPSPQHRSYHLYLVEPSNSEWKARLAFRNYLREHAEARQEYEDLKLGLAKKFKNDREAYTLAKSKFVKDIVVKAQV